MTESSHKRYAKNFMVFPAMQTRMSYYFVAFAVCVIGVMMLMLNHYVTQLRDLIADAPGLPMSTQFAVDAHLQSIITSSLLFLLLALIVSVVYGIIISHRVAGPMFAILKYIESLRAGRYDESRKLRPYDELVPIMNALHEFADDLKKKK
jgi:nitrate/nitrite-specific signal transduction histidine kinase